MFDLAYVKSSILLCIIYFIYLLYLSLFIYLTHVHFKLFSMVSALVKITYWVTYLTTYVFQLKLKFLYHVVRHNGIIVSIFEKNFWGTPGNCGRGRNVWLMYLWWKDAFRRMAENRILTFRWRRIYIKFYYNWEFSF